MDKLKSKTRSARNRLAEASSSGSGTGELHGPHQSLVPHENSSTYAVNEGYQGGEPGTNAQDFGAADDQPTQQPVLEPPTSLQSSIDAGSHVPKPTRTSDPSSHVTYKSVPTCAKKQRAIADLHQAHSPRKEQEAALPQTEERPRPSNTHVDRKLVAKPALESAVCLRPTP